MRRRRRSRNSTSAWLVSRRLRRRGNSTQFVDEVRRRRGGTRNNVIDAATSNWRSDWERARMQVDNILNIYCELVMKREKLQTNKVQFTSLTVILSSEFCISMYINLYIARPTYYFILIYTCGLTVVIKRICYVMLCSLSERWLMSNMISINATLLLVHFFIVCKFYFHR